MEYVMCASCAVVRSQRYRATVYLGVLCAATSWLQVGLAAGGEFEPEYEKAELLAPDTTKFNRVMVKRGWHAFQDVGGQHLAVEGDAVRVLPREGGKEPCRIPSSDGRVLRWLGASGKIAFFVAENTEADVRAGRRYLLAEIRRLDLDSHSWLPSWKVGPESDTQP